ncbi:MAG TPA: hypothetical protein DCO72_05085 [Ruminococcus sp.]|jgi:hypothetical protein|nr:hypothetical protein [Ruminococcus sp.]
MNFYRIQAENTLPDEVWSYFSAKQKACQNSCFQLLSTQSVKISLPETADFEEADFYYLNGLIPLFSVRTYQKIRFTIEKRSESYHIVNGITLCYEGRNYQYVLLLPAGISCMNNFHKISERKIGYLDLFRNMEEETNSLYCTETFRELIQKSRPFGIDFQLV